MTSLRIASIVLGISTAGLVAMACASRTSDGASTSNDEVKSTATLVVSQVYPGGGAADDGYKSDFVELFNRSQKPLSTDGMVVAFLSDKGAFSPLKALELPNGRMMPGGHFLIQLASGEKGKALEGDTKPDGLFEDADLDPAKGQVAIFASMDKLKACTPESCETLDLVGYGEKGIAEGASAAAGFAPQQAATRKNNGCLDTNDNATDFEAAKAFPRNMDAQEKQCPDDGSTAPPPDAGSDASSDAGADAAPKPSTDAGQTKPPPPKKPTETTPAKDDGEDDADDTADTTETVSPKPAAPKDTTKPGGAAATCAQSAGPASGLNLAGALGFGLALAALARRRRAER